MSSFVIGKVSYVRCAGLVAGVAKAANSTGFGDKFWLFNFAKQRNCTKEDYLEKFLEVWKINIESVCKQYKTNVDEYADDRDYSEEFDKYFAYGQRIYHVKEDMLEAIYSMIQFARSVNYQIEDMEGGLVAGEFLNAVIVKMIGVTDWCDDRCWGEFDMGVA